MLKTFFASPLVGGISAVLGWLGALMFERSMSPAEFASLRFGWPGAIIAGVAIASIVLIFFAGSIVEPLMTVASAAVVTALLWNRREFPFDTSNFESGTSTAYWYAVTAMIAGFILLLLGLRAARESTNRARS